MFRLNMYVACQAEINCNIDILVILLYTYSYTLYSTYCGAQTKRPKTKRPKGQNVPRDKTSQETKRPKEKKFYI